MRFRSTIRVALLTAMGLAACRKDHFADGIGRPGQVFIDQPQLADVAIVEVFPADTGAFVEVLAGGSDIDVGAFQLELPGQPPIAIGVGTLQAGTRMTIPVVGFTAAGGSLNVAQSGEVALVEIATEVVHSYFAWGSDPSGRGSTLRLRALQSGASSAVIAVPFPRAVGTSVVRESTQVGCDVPTPGAPPSGTTCVLPAPALRLDEVGSSNGPTDVSFVELTNISGGVLDLDGVRVCHDGGCGTLGAQSIGASATLVVCLGGATQCSPGGLLLSSTTAIAGDTEAFLAAPGTGSVTADALLDYMRTSGGPNALEAAAIARGLWGPSAAPLGTYVPGESSSRNPGPTTPPVWNPAPATPGAANPIIDHVTNWPTCAEPAAAALVPASVIASVISRADGTVTLTNVGVQSVSVADLVVLVDDVALALAGTALDPQASLSAQASIADSGKIEIRVAGALVQFAQWGNPAAGVSAAIAAQLWPREDCVLPRLVAGESLVARDPSLSRGSGGYDIQ